MKPILYNAEETDFLSNGLGRLSDAISCTVTEERNGRYELEMQYPMTGRHYSEIAEGLLIATTHDDRGDMQPFRIYKITRPINGIITAYAEHISYLLSKVVVTPFTASNCAGALSGLVSHAVGDCPFQVWTDKELSAAFAVKVPTSFRSLLGGTEGSILDVFGPGEYEFDRYVIKFHSARGLDSGVTIRYGKNMTDVNKTTDISSMWNSVIPFWQNSEDGTVTMLPEIVVHGDDNPVKRVIPFDLTMDYQEQPTEAQMRSRATAYINNNMKTSVPTTIDISFVDLRLSDEYKDVAPLQRLRLCDTVTVYHTALGIANKAKIISATYNVLLDRYDKMTIGDVRAHLAEQIKDDLSDEMHSVADALRRSVPSTSSMNRAIQHATSLISGGLGGYVLINTNANGQPNEILILDNPDKDLAVNVLRINSSGIGFSSTGYAGTYRSAWTLDGHFVADFIDTGTLTATLLRTGTIASASGDPLINLDTGSINLNGQVTANNNVTIGTDGKLKAVNGEFSGKITSDEGAIAGFTLKNGYMYAGANVSSDSQWMSICQPKGTTGDIYIGGKGISTDFYETFGNTLYRHITSLEDGRIVFRNNSYTVGSLGASANMLNLMFWSMSGNNVMYLHDTGVHFTRDLTCAGQKSREVSTPDFGDRLLYAYETPTPYFGDIGEGRIGQDGECRIDIDPVFVETISEDTVYQVFLTAYGEGSLFVSERHSGYFIVRGTPGLSFAWELKAKQRDYDQRRMDEQLMPNISGVDYGAEAAEYIQNITDERVSERSTI